LGRLLARFERDQKTAVGATYLLYQNNRRPRHALSASGTGQFHISRPEQSFELSYGKASSNVRLTVLIVEAWQA
jgi:hypothetical protein